MQLSKFNKLGWVFAAAMGAVLIGSGFQGPSEKTGVVDISKVVEDSEFGKQSQETFRVMKTSREAVLEFIDDHRVLTQEQAVRLKDLSLKTNATDADKSALETLRAEIMLSGKRSMELAQKPSLTAEERTLLEEYARRSQTMEQVAQRWFREFSSEMQGWADKQKLASLDRARGAIQEVARQQGFTVVFEVGIAPYGANDLTSAALQAMNTRR
jgi:Skp family chaperone for outer membrane proteins